MSYILNSIDPGYLLYSTSTSETLTWDLPHLLFWTNLFCGWGSSTQGSTSGSPGLYSLMCIICPSQSDLLNGCNGPFRLSCLPGLVAVCASALTIISDVCLHMMSDYMVLCSLYVGPCLVSAWHNIVYVCYTTCLWPCSSPICVFTLL